MIDWRQTGQDRRQSEPLCRGDPAEFDAAGVVERPAIAGWAFTCECAVEQRRAAGSGRSAAALEVSHRYLIGSGGHMQAIKAAGLRRDWRKKTCHHREIEKEYHLDNATGDYVCTTCGRLFTASEARQHAAKQTTKKKASRKKA